MRSGRRLIFALLALVIAGGAVFVAEQLRGPASSAATGDARAPRILPAVEIAAATTGRVVDDIAVVGSLQPSESVVIQPEISGRIIRFGFTDGARVKKGDVLVELDPAILRA